MRSNSLKKGPGGIFCKYNKRLFMVFGLNGLAIRAPDAKLPPNCTKSRFGAFGTSPGPQDQKNIYIKLILIKSY